MQATLVFVVLVALALGFPSERVRRDRGSNNGDGGGDSNAGDSPFSANAGSGQGSFVSTTSKTFVYNATYCNRDSHGNTRAWACTELPEQKLASNSYCVLPLVSGTACGTATTAYYYNFQTGTCASFTYLGCNGNANRFSTLAACQATCPNRDPCDDTTMMNTWATSNWNSVKSSFKNYSLDSPCGWNNVLYNEGNKNYDCYFKYLQNSFTQKPWAGCGTGYVCSNVAPPCSGLVCPKFQCVLAPTTTSTTTRTSTTTLPTTTTTKTSTTTTKTTITSTTTTKTTTTSTTT